jgi:hypothetical protein
LKRRLLFFEPAGNGILAGLLQSTPYSAGWELRFGGDVDLKRGRDRVVFHEFERTKAAVAVASER